VRDYTLGQYVRFPRSARPSHPLRQQSLASNPSEYDKAPKVKAFGNRGSGEDLILEQQAARG
jgi:hypothetical protein